MELKHTPGPWEKDHGMTDGHIKSISKYENNNYTPTVCRYKNLYAGDFTVADSLTAEEQEANGLLISAAPEMLERLITEYEIASTNPPDFSLMERLSHIIEKATGLKIEEILK